MMLLTSISMYGQSTHDVSGTVVDKATGEAVIGGSIKLMTLSDSSFVEGTTTGPQGEFSLKSVKKGMKNGWYGNVNLGVGTQHRYSEKFNVNHFKDDFQATLLGSANNVANMGFGGGGGRWGWGDQGLSSSKEIGGNFATAKPKLETGSIIRAKPTVKRIVLR